MLTKTYRTKLERVTITMSEPEIREAIKEWLVKHDHVKKIDRSKNSSLISEALELFEDNHAEYVMDYNSQESI